MPTARSVRPVDYGEGALSCRGPAHRDDAVSAVHPGRIGDLRTRVASSPSRTAPAQTHHDVLGRQRLEPDVRARQE